MRNRWPYAFAGLATGVVALIVLTAIIAAAVSSSAANDRLERVSSHLDAVSARLNQTATELGDLKSEQAQRQQQTVAARKVVMEQNRNLRGELAALTAFLHAQGLAVPQAVVTVTAPPAAAPTPTAPNPTPAPTPGKHGKGKAKGHHKK